MIEALRLWKLRPFKFKETFRYQYVISQDDLEVPFFNTVKLGGWHISSGADLPVAEILDKSGKKVGFILGIGVARSGLISGSWQLDLSSRTKSFFDKFEELLKDVAGRYAIILSANKQTRFYCDPVGTIGAVYEAEHMRVAASPLLAIDRPVIPNPSFDHEKMEALGGKYSIFHTADAHIKRLNPNCYLDLETFQESRFWPKDEVFDASEAEYLDIFSEISTTTKFNIEQIADHYPTAMPVSGGQDSRLLLAMAGDAVQKVSQVFTHVDKWITTIDAMVGEKIANAAGVKHETHHKDDHDVSKREQQQLKTRYSIAFGNPAEPARQMTNGAVRSLKKNAVVLRGHQTDLLRAVFVRRQKKFWTDFKWQLELLLILPRGHLDQETEDVFTPDYQKWYDSLPSNAVEKSVDFMFLEIYYSSTIGASFPASWNNFYMSPYNSRRLIELSLKFKEDFRKASLPVFCITQLQNPDIAQVFYDFEYTHRRNKGDDGVHKIERVYETVQKRMDKTSALLESFKGKTSD